MDKVKHFKMVCLAKWYDIGEAQTNMFSYNKYSRYCTIISDVSPQLQEIEKQYFWDNMCHKLGGDPLFLQK